MMKEMKKQVGKTYWDLVNEMKRDKNSYGDMIPTYGDTINDKIKIKKII